KVFLIQRPHVRAIIGKLREFRVFLRARSVNRARHFIFTGISNGRLQRSMSRRVKPMNLQQNIASCCLILIVMGAVSGRTRESRQAAHAPEPAYGIDFWRDAEGFPQSRIRAITQTRDGYIWLGTDNGLVRFNGAAFTAFTVETGTLKDNEVWALREDSDGGLWIGTYGGGLTLLKNGRFKTFTTADGLPDDVIMKVDQDREGNIGIGTPSGVGLYSQGGFRTFTIKDGLSDNFVTALTAGAQGVFVATRSRLQRFVAGRFEPMTDVLDE